MNSALYPHNLFLELLYQYGIIFGGFLGALLLALIFKTWKAVLIKKNSHLSIIFYSLVMTFFIKSMISSSYLVDYASGIALGACFSILNIVKDEYIKTNADKFYK